MLSRRLRRGALAPNTGVDNGYGMSIGSDFNLVDSAARKSYFADIRSLGCTWVRFDASWATIQEAGSGTWNFATLDAVVSEAQAVGLKILLVPGFAPAWAGPQGSKPCYPYDNATYQEFVRGLVSRYYPIGVHHYEIWNEPNNFDFLSQSPTNLLPDAGKYTALLKAGYAGAKAGNVNAFVISGGLASGDGTDPRFIKPTVFLQAMYDNGAKGYFDAVGHHPYGMPALPGDIEPWSNWSAMNDWSPSLRSIMIDQGDGGKPIWLTENGELSCGPQGWYSEDHQAALYAQAIRTQRSYRWAGPQFFWTYIDRAPAVNNPDGADLFGIYTSDGRPKQVVHTLRHSGTPTAATGVYVQHTPGTTVARLVFGAPLDDGASPVTGFAILVQDSDGVTVHTVMAAASATAYDVSPLGAGTYTFNITPQNANGVGASVSRTASIFPVVQQTFYVSGFESDAGYFGGANGATVAQSSDAAFGGSGSLKVTHSTQAGSQAYAGPLTSLAAGARIGLTFMYRMPHTGTKILALLDFFDSSSNYLSSLSAEYAGDNAHWQYGEVVGAVPSGAERCAILFRKANGSTATSTVYFDSVSLLQ